MNIINVLIVVDTVGALSSETLQDNVYLADNNHYLGSWGQGTNTLHTVVQNGQQINWAVAAIAPSNEVIITGFTGAMITDKICIPKESGLAQATIWSGTVQTQGDISPWGYTITLTIDAKPMSFNSLIKVL